MLRETKCSKSRDLIAIAIRQQDTEECLNHKGTEIRVFWASEKGGQRGRWRGETWYERGQGMEDKEGGRMREKGWEERGPKALPLYPPYDLGTL